LVFGDNGQIEFFKKRTYTGKADNLSSINTWYEENLLKEEYFLDHLECKVKLISKNKTDEFYDLNEKGGLENFSKLLLHNTTQNLIRQSDSIVILGDMVYPEKKNLAINNIILLFKDKWINRLKCAWNLFFNVLQKVDLIKIQNNTKIQQFEDFKKIKIDEKLDLIAGNHAFDIDVQIEEDFIKYLNYTNLSYTDNSLEIEKKAFGDDSKKRFVFTYTPKFIKVIGKRFQIEFLDFNANIISCLIEKNEADYLKCNQNPSVLSYQEAKEYSERLFMAFSKFTKENKNNIRIWKVVRSHQPPFNSEDTDRSSDYFFRNIHSKNNNYIIFELLKNYKINIYLASHIHISQVIVYPYSRPYTPLKESCKELELTNPQFGCMISKSIFSEPIQIEQCKNHLNFNLHLNLEKKEFNLNNSEDMKENQILYIFINGSSGRNLDGLKYGYNSNGITLWSRAFKDKYGFAFGFSKINFNESSIKVEFFELENESNSLVKTATFNIINGSLPDMNNLIGLIDNKCFNISEYSSILSFIIYSIIIISLIGILIFFIFRKIRKYQNDNDYYKNFPDFNKKQNQSQKL